MSIAVRIRNAVPEGAVRAIQLARIARTVTPPSRYLGDVLRNRPEGTYVARRTGHTVHFRPRSDMQVVRELVSKDVYEPPAEVQRILARHDVLRVLDLGANIGLFSLAAVHRYGPGTRLTAVEPDPSNQPLLRQNLASNGLESTVILIPAAVGVAPGTMRLAAGLNHNSHAVDDASTNGESMEVEVVDFFAIAEGHHLIKMDIEGGEWDILRDPRLPGISADALVLEWHVGGAPNPDQAGTAERLLAAAGFVVRHDAEHGPTAGGLWAFRA